MKKIIAAIDGLKYSESTTEYAAQLTRETHSHLVGVFNEDKNYHSYSIYELTLEDTVEGNITRTMDEHDKMVQDNAASQFTETCRSARINFSIHHGKSAAMPQLLHESLFADLMIICKKETFSRFDQDVPTSFVRHLLENAECPVVVVPQQFENIEKVVLLYDGGPASVHAIKMFSYLLPSLGKLPIEVLTVKPCRLDLHLPENRLMKEFMKRHFPDASYKVVHGEPVAEIIKHLKNKHQDELVVLGAFQRSMVSRWLRVDMADHLMAQLKTPLFIAHR